LYPMHNPLASLTSRPILHKPTVATRFGFWLSTMKNIS
jgi:hypothetical protein